MPIAAMIREIGLNPEDYNLAKAVSGGSATYLPPALSMQVGSTPRMGAKLFKLGDILRNKYSDIRQEAAIMNVGANDPSRKSRYFSKPGNVIKNGRYVVLPVEHSVMTLNQIMRNHQKEGSAVSLTEKLLVLQSCAGAYSLLHEYGLIDPDLKPANVGISVDSQGKVVAARRIDLGAARRIKGTTKFDVLEENTKSDIPLYDSNNNMDGTRGLLAPEEYLLDLQVGTRTDSYKLALFINDLFTATTLNELDDLESKVINPNAHARAAQNMSFRLQGKLERAMKQEFGLSEYRVVAPVLQEFVTLFEKALHHNIDQRPDVDDMYEISKVLYEAVAYKDLTGIMEFRNNMAHSSDRTHIGLDDTPSFLQDTSDALVLSSDEPLHARLLEYADQLDPEFLRQLKR